MSVIFKGRIVAGKLVVDAVPTAGSTNPVSSQGVKSALDTKQNTLTFDQTPTAGSQNPVTSGGVKSALNAVDESIAIRVSGNKTTYASGAAIGQYVIVDGSTIAGITDGIYKAAKAIPYNTGIDSTYLTAASGGGLNELNAAMYNTDVTALTTTQAYYELYDTNHYKNAYIKRGGFCYVTFSIKCITPQTETLITNQLPMVSPSSIGTSLTDLVYDDSDTGTTMKVLVQNGNLYVYGGTSWKTYRKFLVYPIAMS